MAQQREFQFDRTRLIGGLAVRVRPVDWLTLEGRQSLDRSFQDSRTFFPVGYETPTPGTVNNGSETRNNFTLTTAISELSANVARSFGDVNSSVTAKYLYEDREFDQVVAGGQNYIARGIRDIGGLDQTTLNIGSAFTEERAENFFVNVDLDYDDTYILSGLVRRDGSSSFGADERYQTYYRLSSAYRLSEDLSLPGVDELKLRASYGTSGQRPPFVAQYETFTATSAGISPGILGNRDLQPSEVQELELGFNAGLFNRTSVEVNYARTQTQNDYLLVPLSAAAGFSAQYQNVGEIESNAFEVAISNYLIQRRDLNLDLNLTFSRVRQQVTDLGGTPPFTITSFLNQGVGALPLFRIEEGVNYGAIFGNQLLTSLDQLTLDEGGAVLNRGVDVNGDGRVTPADYTVNSQGFVVPAQTVGAGQPDNRQPVYLVDENGEQAVVQIGDTQPDFQLGFTSNFNFKGFGVFALVDWVQGADVYNYTKQLLYFNDRHQDQQDFAEQGFGYGYTNGSSAIYNAASASSFFVEDASFVKLREVALSYTLGSGILQRYLGDRANSIKLSLIGRNLLTFTDYTGFDPEVALRSNATNFRLDEFAYPNFRTFTAAIDVRF